MPDYTLIPEHMRDGARNWVEHGRPGGGFLMALFSGDLEYARIKADGINAAAFDSWLQFIRWEIPASCHGTPENVKVWQELGGAVGNPATQDTGKPKIFVFINGGKGTDWVRGCAIAEDGSCLAGHISSSDSWFMHDMGLNSDWKHDQYKEHYPDGFDLVHVIDPGNDEGLHAAYELNQQKKAAAAE